MAPRPKIRAGKIHTRPGGAYGLRDRLAHDMFHKDVEHGEHNVALHGLAPDG